jgi:hypothetical protein
MKRKENEKKLRNFEPLTEKIKTLEKLEQHVRLLHLSDQIKKGEKQTKLIENQFNTIDVRAVNTRRVHMRCSLGIGPKTENLITVKKSQTTRSLHYFQAVKDEMETLKEARNTREPTR